MKINQRQFVWLDGFNNPINIFLINPKIILYCLTCIKYLWISYKILLVLTGLKSIEENLKLPFILFFCIFQCKMCWGIT